MNQQELLQKRSEIESQFNEKKAAREEHLSTAASLLEGMTQLQGAYAVLTELSEPVTVAEEQPTVTKTKKK